MGEINCIIPEYEESSSSGITCQMCQQPITLQHSMIGGIKEDGEEMVPLFHKNCYPMFLARKEINSVDQYDKVPIEGTDFYTWKKKIK